MHMLKVIKPIALLIIILLLCGNDRRRFDPIDFFLHIDSAVVDTVAPPIFGSSLYYGMDSSVNPCDDFYSYVNGGWRKVAILPKSARNETGFSYISIQNMAVPSIYRHILSIVDSALQKKEEIEDPTLRTVATFYQSCIAVDTIDKNPLNISRRNSSTPVDSSRRVLCLERIFKHVGGAAGQIFTGKLKRSSSSEKLKLIQAGVVNEIMTRVAVNSILTPNQKKRVSESLTTLKLRVGIPEEEVDYSQLFLSETDYYQNIKTVKDYLRRIRSNGPQPKDQWSYGLIRANANYIRHQHAIEIPPTWFFPPFFYEDADEAVNFAAVGWLIGHEIHHGLEKEILDSLSEYDKMSQAIDLFIAATSGLGTLDGWRTDGRMTLKEDLADLGGGRAAYYAWKKTFSNRADSKRSLDSSGFTPDQKFFIAMGRFWRAKWEGKVAVGSHAAPFARVNSIVMQIPEFAQAFGCKSGDKMYLPPDKISKIW